MIDQPRTCPNGRLATRVLVYPRGGLDSCRGQVRRAWVSSYEDGIKRLQEIGKRRRQRGYRAVSEARS
jgi:hypothetical protein